MRSEKDKRKERELRGSGVRGKSVCVRGGQEGKGRGKSGGRGIRRQGLGRREIISVPSGARGCGLEVYK